MLKLDCSNGGDPCTVADYSIPCEVHRRINQPGFLNRGWHCLKLWQFTLHLFFFMKVLNASVKGCTKSKVPWRLNAFPSVELKSLNITTLVKNMSRKSLAFWCMLTPERESIAKACQSILKRDLLEPNWFESMHSNALAEAIRLCTATGILGHRRIPGPPGFFQEDALQHHFKAGYKNLPAASGRAQPQPFESRPGKNTVPKSSIFHPACNVSMDVNGDFRTLVGGTVPFKARFWGHIPWALTW